jgi:hypothetical protein
MISVPFTKYAPGTARPDDDLGRTEDDGPVPEREPRVPDKDEVGLDRGWLVASRVTKNATAAITMVTAAIAIQGFDRAFAPPMTYSPASGSDGQGHSGGRAVIARLIGAHG